MSRYSRINWRKGGYNELKRVVKNYNARVDYARAKNPGAAYLPGKVSAAELKAGIQTRSDLKKTMARLERFTDKTAEPVEIAPGVQSTRWERQNLSINLRIINRAKTMEKKRTADIEIFADGVTTGTTRGEMGTPRMEELKPKNFDPDLVKSLSDWIDYKNRIAKQAETWHQMETLERYKANYLKMVEQVFGGDATDIIERLTKVPARKIVDMYYSNPDAGFDFLYDPTDYDDKLSLLDDIWSEENLID